MQEIEIEFKNMITKEEYEMLLSHFSLSKEEAIMQENHYFDTPDFSLKKMKSALRIREKNGSYTLTLKQPAQVGLLETHQTLTKDETMKMMNHSFFINGEIRKILEDSSVDVNKIEYFGSLKTNRIEFHYNNGVLTLDESFYLDHQDYEIEYEVKNINEGEENFNKFLQQFNIPIRKTNNKIERFYLRKQQIGSSNSKA